jgi:ABC-type transport system substrate-binding protein
VRSIVLTAALAMLAAHAALAASPGTLRVGMPTTPRSLDPARAEISQEFMVMAGIYDSLYTLDPLAPGAVLVPLAAAGLPDVSDDFRTYTIRVRPGIYFTPHPAFRGQRRELVAKDFEYSIRRLLDPKLRSPSQSVIEGKILGLDALARAARDAGRGLDYDTPVEGLVAVDAHTLRVRLTSPDPRFAYVLAGALIAGVAREVVEAEGESYPLRPIGTGPFMVETFTSGQRLTLVRNPGFRELRFEDLVSLRSASAARAHPLAGKKLPGLDRVELSSTPEASAELLALLRGEVDVIVVAAPGTVLDNGLLKDELARAGVRLVRNSTPIVLAWYFNMRDPVVGGSSREKVALRRAIAMAFDDAEWGRVFYGAKMAAPAQWIPTGIEGHVDGYQSGNRFDPPAANALLDRMGYRRGPDGYRSNPDGSPLVVTWLDGTTSEHRARDEFYKRMLDRIGVRTAFEAAPAGERIRRISRCAYGATTMDWAVSTPDGTDPMAAFYGKMVGNGNSSCYEDAAFDAAYDKALAMPSGAARAQLFREMQSRIDAYVPARPLPTGDLIILTSGRVVGPFAIMGDWLQLATLAVKPQ